MATDNYIVGRNANYFMAPFTSGGALLPANTVDWGTDWTSPWVNVGTTSGGGMTLNIETTLGAIVVDQYEDAVRRPITGRSITAGLSLAQHTLANMQRAIGYGAIASNAPGSGTRGDDTLTITSGSKPSLYSLGADILDDESTMPVRMEIFKGQMTSSVSSQFGQAEALAVLPIQVMALPDPTTSPARLVAVRHVIPALP